MVIFWASEKGYRILHNVQFIFHASLDSRVQSVHCIKKYSNDLFLYCIRTASSDKIYLNVGMY